MESKIIEVEFGAFIVYKNGEIYNFKTKRKLNYIDNGLGYQKVGLYIGNNKHKKYYVHRLLATAFIPNPENKKFINHIDGNPKNNNLNNLEWCTKSENGLHAYKLGLNWSNPKLGEYHPQSKLNDEIVKKIKTLYSLGNRQIDISRELGISKYQVNVICLNKAWKHITI